MLLIDENKAGALLESDPNDNTIHECLLSNGRFLFQSDNANLDPELAESIRWRRSQIVKRFPSLALAKLASYEKLRSDLAEAVCKNLERHPGNRSTDMEAMEEAHLIVTAATTVQWAAATSATRRGRTLTSTNDFDIALAGLQKIFSAIEPTTPEPTAETTKEKRP